MQSNCADETALAWSSTKAVYTGEMADTYESLKSENNNFSNIRSYGVSNQIGLNSEMFNQDFPLHQEAIADDAIANIQHKVRRAGAEYLMYAQYGNAHEQAQDGRG